MPRIRSLRLVLVFIQAVAMAVPMAAAETVAERLARIQVITIPEDAPMVCRSVAREIRDSLVPTAAITTEAEARENPPAHILRIELSDAGGKQADGRAADSQPRMLLRIPDGGPVVLSANRPHLLYALAGLLLEEWRSLDTALFAEGKAIEPAFEQIVGEDGFYGFWRRFSVGYNADEAISETARLGASHVVVNALPSSFAMEDGPAGEIYYRFYQYLPDIDQYVETDLNAGTYPPEYLQANLKFLKEQAQQATAHGLVPGMHVANPRSVPESLLQKYPYLRGARVDHPFRSYRPRYTLTLAHPLTRWHYASLLKNLLQEVPEIGFLTILVNDSGSGFEYTESLYPGRNGGPYLVREWQPDEVIARKASELIIQYYIGMRDAAREINPDFRIHTGLNNIKEEKEVIYNGLSDGLDRLVRTQRMDIREDRERNEKLEKRGSYRIGHVAAEGNPYIIGVPAPWKVFEDLEAEKAAGTSRLEVVYDPPSLAPYDPNREVLRAFQLGLADNVETVITALSREFVGQAHAGALADIWKLSDAAVRTAPVMPLYGNLGFAWYRFWVRPFVPDIEAIPVSDRAYYEDYMLSIFNNPNNVDFQADALWDIHETEQSRHFMDRFDSATLPLIAKALDRVREELDKLPAGSRAEKVFSDLEARLRAYQCYSVTLRNIAAWIVGVHGFLDAESDSERRQSLEITRDMVSSELANTRHLLDLWRQGGVHFMPVNASGEWMHDYGPNFGSLLERKIALMEQYGDRDPRIDPDYMWRLPAPEEVELAPPVDPGVYLQY